MFDLNLNMPSARVATARRKTAWDLESEQSSTMRVMRHLGVSQEESKAYVEAPSRTFDVADCNTPGKLTPIITAGPKAG